MVMIAEVVTDFENILTGDLFKIAWQKCDFVSKISLLQEKKMALVLSDIQVSDPEHLGSLVVLHFCTCTCI